MERKQTWRNRIHDRTRPTLDFRVRKAALRPSEAAGCPCVSFILNEGQEQGLEPQVGLQDGTDKVKLYS